HRSRGPSTIYFVSPYPWGWMPSGGSQTGSSVPGVVAEPPEEERSGTIRLDVAPAVPFQIYVDSYFVGTSNDLGNTLGLEAGPHRIEIRAEGYAPHVFDTKVAPGVAITYQAGLEPLEAPQAPEASEPVPQAPASGTAPAPGPTTIYFIPGCYLGNLPPDALKMPAGCDLARLQTCKP